MVLLVCREADPTVSCLPATISDGLNFFEACLKEKVIVVPGIFFDLNPARRRDLFDSPCHHFVCTNLTTYCLSQC